MLSMRPKHLKRYRDFAWLLIKYGKSELAKKLGLADLLDNDGEQVQNSTADRAAELAGDLESRGPTFVKLGQMLSTRSDLLPAPYTRSLKRLQDDVQPFSFDEVQQTLVDDLGLPPAEAFRQFEATPVASASLSQVHRAVLPNGRWVAVKVQRPGVREQIVDDLDALEDLADMLERHTETGNRYGLCRILDTFRRSLLGELDFRNEADHLETVGENMREFDRILVPRPVHERTSARVLTMEHISGRKVVELDAAGMSTDERRLLAKQLFRGYLQQVFVDGFFHADPHPGNLLLTPNGRIALLDLGMVVRVTPRLQEHLLKLLLSLAEGRGEDAAEVVTKIGYPVRDYNKAEFQEQITHWVLENQETSLDRTKLGHVVLQLNAIAADHWLRLPEEIALISKTLLNLDQSLVSLDGQFDLSAAVRERAVALVRKRQRPQFSIGRLYHSLSETNEFIGLLPERLNKILDLAAENQLKVDVNAIDEQKLIQGIQKVANRITAGLLMAALIIGASVMMHVETSITLFGYPAIAMFFFIVAALGALTLIVQILFKDRKKR